MSSLEMFRKKLFGGLDPENVQTHLDKLYEERRRYQDRVARLEAQLSDLQIMLKGYEEKEKALKESMDMADAYAKKIEAEAKDRREEIILKAQLEAKDVLDRAREKRSGVEQEILRLQKQKQVILSDIRGICSRHMSLVRAEMVEHDSLSLIDENKTPSSDVST